MEMMDTGREGDGLTDRKTLSRLDDFLLVHGVGGVALAWSGGVDSSFLEWRLKVLGVRLGLKRVDTPMLDVPEVVANGRDRCYHCKSAIFRQVWAFARAQGLAVVMDGTNADDMGTYRPGLRALVEQKVISPLKEVGMGKAAIRRIAAAAGLPFASMASSPCAATRFPYGESLTREGIARVEAAEEFLRRMLPEGIDIRVRSERGAARLEVSPSAMAKVHDHWSQIAGRLDELGFSTVEIDPVGYRTGV